MVYDPAAGKVWPPPRGVLCILVVKSVDTERLSGREFLLAAEHGAGL